MQGGHSADHVQHLARVPVHEEDVSADAKVCPGGVQPVGELPPDHGIVAQDPVAAAVGRLLRLPGRRAQGGLFLASPGGSFLSWPAAGAAGRAAARASDVGKARRSLMPDASHVGQMSGRGLRPIGERTPPRSPETPGPESRGGFHGPAPRQPGAGGAQGRLLTKEVGAVRMSDGKKRKLGLALGSGGARGWCHIGVIRALEEIGVRPDVVAGCSMGAVVGAAWASGKLDALEEFARQMSRTRFLSYFDIGLARGGLVQGRSVMEALERMGVPDDFAALDRRLIAVATDMSTGREIWLQEGPLLEALRASFAIPGLFAPYHLDGRWLIDGGIVNPVPSSACRALGADVTIAVNPNGRDDGRFWSPEGDAADLVEGAGGTGLLAHLPPAIRDLWDRSDSEPKPPNYFEVVAAAIDILSEHVHMSRRASDPPHLALAVDLQHLTFIELYRAHEAIDAGHAAVMRSRDDLEKLLEKM